MAVLKFATAYIRTFFLVQTADHRSGLTGAAPVVKLGKSNATGVAATNSPATQIDATNLPGWYYITLTPADTSAVGDLIYTITAASADPTNFVDQVQTNILTDINLDASGNVSIASNIKKNQVLNGFTFVMTNSTSHAAAPGLSVTAQRSLGGGGFAPCANGVTELSNGCYVINLAASDLNANAVMLRFTAPTADDLDIELLTQP